MLTLSLFSHLYPCPSFIFPFLPYILVSLPNVSLSLGVHSGVVTIRNEVFKVNISAIAPTVSQGDPKDTILVVSIID